MWEGVGRFWLAGHPLYPWHQVEVEGLFTDTHVCLWGPCAHSQTCIWSGTLGQLDCQWKRLPSFQRYALWRGRHPEQVPQAQRWWSLDQTAWWLKPIQEVQLRWRNLGTCHLCQAANLLCRNDHLVQKQRQATSAPKQSVLHLPVEAHLHPSDYSRCKRPLEVQGNLFEAPVDMHVELLTGAIPRPPAKQVVRGKLHPTPEPFCLRLAQGLGAWRCDCKGKLGQWLHLAVHSRVYQWGGFSGAKAIEKTLVKEKVDKLYM